MGRSTFRTVAMPFVVLSEKEIEGRSPLPDWYTLSVFIYARVWVYPAVDTLKHSESETLRFEAAWGSI